jgi:hypothetical protein
MTYKQLNRGILVAILISAVAVLTACETKPECLTWPSNVAGYHWSVTDFSENYTVEQLVRDSDGLIVGKVRQGWGTKRVWNFGNYEFEHKVDAEHAAEAGVGQRGDL